MCEVSSFPFPHFCFLLQTYRTVSILFRWLCETAVVSYLSFKGFRGNRRTASQNWSSSAWRTFDRCVNQLSCVFPRLRSNMSVYYEFSFTLEILTFVLVGHCDYFGFGYKINWEMLLHFQTFYFTLYKGHWLPSTLQNISRLLFVLICKTKSYFSREFNNC